jgi:hypothetical protein
VCIHGVRDCFGLSLPSSKEFKPRRRNWHHHITPSDHIRQCVVVCVDVLSFLTLQKTTPPATRYRGRFFCFHSARRVSTRRRAKLRFAGWIRHGPACYRKIVSEPNYFFSCPKSAPTSPKMAPVLDHPTNNNNRRTHMHTHAQCVLLLLRLRWE